MTVSPGARLRERLAEPGALVVPFAYDAFSARLIEEAGFGAVGISGSAVAASLLALPDVGLMSREEVVGQARRIAAAVHLPVFADADTGYGGPLQAARTVREFEGAGLAGLFMEDQRDPKRCGHLSGTQVVPIDEMLGKLRAVLSARTDPDFVVIARTDAIESEGLDAAAARARAYLDAGADVAFVAAPPTREDLERLPRVVGEGALLMVVLSEGGRTPSVAITELAAMGYKVVGYSGLAIGAAARAVQRELRALRERGTNAGLLDRVMALDERNQILGLAAYQALEAETVR
ncbi:MAG: isocitrate lyase/phosphoenolpyruvate mutase family protein [Chloroflexi bacterium]|nr:isocitrate lyase/phosphoenolpyruvate mutase family protein [Chloroflexota bacterium]